MNKAQWRIQGRGPGDLHLLYFLTKLRLEGPKKKFLETVPAPPFSEGLDSPLKHNEIRIEIL